MYVVAGVSGNTGSVVANVLLSEGEPVRVLVRDAAKGAAWKAKGAEVVVADLDDEAALRGALEGARGAYLLLPPLMHADYLATRTETGKKLARAAKASGVPHVVLLSSVGAQHAAGTGPIVTAHRAENELRAAGVNATFVRAAYFLDNLAGMLHPAATDGVFPSFQELDTRFPMVATDDIGRTVARVLREPHQAGERPRTVNLHGAAEHTMTEAAAAFGRALGRVVRPVRVPREAVSPTLAGFGVPKANADGLAELAVGVDSGHVRFDAHGDTARGSVSLDAFVTRLVASQR